MTTKKSWFAIYVKARHELKVLDALKWKEIECYLPMRKELRQWSDRKKMVEEPLIRGYIFVRLDLRHYYDVLVVPGVISFVSFGKQPAEIPDYQIEDLKIFLKNGSQQVEVTNEFVRKGEFVKVNHGPFQNAIGEVVQLRGKKRLLIRIKALGCAVHAELGANQVLKLSEQEQGSIA